MVSQIKIAIGRQYFNHIIVFKLETISFAKVRYILIIILFFEAGIMVGFAQKSKVQYLTTFDDKKIHFGFTLGVSTLDFGVSNYHPIGENPAFKPGKWSDEITEFDTIRADIASMIPGFTVGIITSLRLNNYMDLRFLPGLSFGERRLLFNRPVLNLESYDTENYYYSIKSTFLDFPLLIKYKAKRINNDRPYIVVGGAYRQDISKTAREDLIRLKNGGFYLEVGAGWDHYFTFFRFSVEAKASLGLNNQLGQGPVEQRRYYSDSIRKLTSNIFTLSFHFE